MLFQRIFIKKIYFFCLDIALKDNGGGWQYPNNLRNFYPYKIGFMVVLHDCPKRGGVISLLFLCEIANGCFNNISSVVEVLSC